MPLDARRRVKRTPSKRPAPEGAAARTHRARISPRAQTPPATVHSQAPVRRRGRLLAHTRWAAGSLLALAVVALFTVPRPSQALLNVVGPSLSPGEQAVPGDVLAKLSAVPTAQLVGAARQAGLQVTLPGALPSSAPYLQGQGKPEVLALCTEYNGYCADISWPLVMALEKFGTFSRLGYTVATGGHNRGTVGFDFYQARYESPYLSFTGVELASSTRTPAGTWRSLQSLTRVQQAVVDDWDVPPYSSPAHSTPFVDFGGHYYQSSPGFGGQGLLGLGHGQRALERSLAVVSAGSEKADVEDIAAHMAGAVCLATKDRPPVCAQLPAALKTLRLPVQFNNETGLPSG